MELQRFLVKLIIFIYNLLNSQATFGKYRQRMKALVDIVLTAELEGAQIFSGVKGASAMWAPSSPSWRILVNLIIFFVACWSHKKNMQKKTLTYLHSANEDFCKLSLPTTSLLIICQLLFMIPLKFFLWNSNQKTSDPWNIIKIFSTHLFMHFHVQSIWHLVILQRKETEKAINRYVDRKKRRKANRHPIDGWSINNSLKRHHKIRISLSVPPPAGNICSGFVHNVNPWEII